MYSLLEQKYRVEKEFLFEAYIIDSMNHLMKMKFHYYDHGYSCNPGYMENHPINTQIPEVVVIKRNTNS